MKDNLVWKEEDRKTVYFSPIFNVSERYCRSPLGKLKTFTIMDTKNWVIVVPVLETGQGKQFVMVKQWRHGAGELSLEFPGGVFEDGEDALVAAVRELREETGYNPGKIEKLGEFNPNPAIMSNRVHFFLAENLESLPALELDDDEFIEVEAVAWEDVLNGLGKPPYIHSLMATALALFLKRYGRGG